jgi:hypothetical protein
MDNTYPSKIPTKTQKVLNPFHALSDTHYGRLEPIVSTLLAQYQAGLDHLIELSIVRMMNLAK